MSDDTLHYLPLSSHLNIAEIDAQHDALFERLAYLKQLRVSQNHLPASETEGLLDLLRAHFVTEQRYATEAGIDFSAHADCHQRLLSQVEKALADATTGEADVFGVLRYVDYWFERHINQKDRDFSLEYMASLGAEKALPSSEAQSNTTLPQTPPSPGD